MNINDNLKDYVPYEQMSEYEKRQVDMLVEQYKNGSLNSDYSGISHNDVDRFINTRLKNENHFTIWKKILDVLYRHFNIRFDWTCCNFCSFWDN